MGLITFALLMGAIWVLVMSGGLLGVLAQAVKAVVEALDRLFGKQDGRSPDAPPSSGKGKPDADGRTSPPLIKKHKVRCPCGNTHIIAAREQIRCSACSRLIALPAKDRQRPPPPS